MIHWAEVSEACKEGTKGREAAKKSFSLEFSSCESPQDKSLFEIFASSEFLGGFSEGLLLRKTKFFVANVILQVSLLKGY